MGQFDHVFRENADQLFISLAQRILNITVVTADELNDKLHTTTREVDFLKKITDNEGKEFILHLEFQTTNDSNMAYRMAEYKALVQAKYQMPVRVNSLSTWGISPLPWRPNFPKNNGLPAMN